MARTAVGKRIKTFYFDVQKALAWDATEYNFYPADSRTMQEDIRIVGVSMSCTAGLNVTAIGSIADGAVHTHGELSRHGERGKPSSILDVNVQLYTGVGTSENFFGNNMGRDSIMFPDGHGVDLDEGEVLYLHAGCFSNASGAGEHEHSVFCLVYYVER